MSVCVCVCVCVCVGGCVKRKGKREREILLTAPTNLAIQPVDGYAKLIIV